MKTVKYADSKRHEPESPESVTLRRQFAERFPDIASGEIFNAGRTAAFEGWGPEANPYIESSPKHEAWRKGYLS
jgi:hypothetical protein